MDPDKTFQDVGGGRPPEADASWLESLDSALPKVCPGCLENYARPEEEAHFASCEGYARWLKRPKLTLAAFQPIWDRVLVRVIPDAVVTASGAIVKPDVARDRPLQAEVLAVGAGRVFDNGVRIAPVVKAGDVVIFQKHGGEKIAIEEEEVLILREDEIMGVFKPALP